MKNRLLTAGAVVLLLLSWPLALRKTKDAIRLNHELSLKSEQATDLSYNPGYLRDKNQMLDHLVSQYRADSAGWKDELWLKASGIASARGASVAYTPGQLRVQADTSSADILRQSISFGGDYRKLVSLLDTLEKVRETGFASSAKFETQKSRNVEESDKLYMKVVFEVIKNKKSKEL
ncbi:hypothetical protein DDR33_24335 [Pararcticibacter amylolyticus]|uniref:Uncharacterized protein n=2 Tax=Pararcticibacter amylolyticus TaxID=2173175 RepID=A0A2U2P9J6_9SPHI|nr:hypothetical protein DDR33_24335 [Pararcticibacter amylolyticus]